MQNSNKKAQEATVVTEADSRSQSCWVTPVSDAIKQTQNTVESKIKTMLTCRTINNKNVLFVPADMAELQPRSLRYLQKFALSNQLALTEDRRKFRAQPIIEKRTHKDPMMILGMSMLLKQAGMPGPARPLSEPNRLKSENPYFSIRTLLDMAAFSAAQAKRIDLTPNRITSKALNNHTQPISGYACNVKTNENTNLLSFFESDNLRAIGYSAGNQFVFHLCLGGGSLENPTLWADIETLQSTDFRFQLFAGKTPADDYALFYSTLYLDLSQAPFPWWISSQPTINDASHDEQISQLSA